MESSVGSTRPNLVKSQDLVSTKTIRQNLHECYANPHDNLHLMEHAGHRPWCLFHCSFRNLGLPTRLAQILHRHLNRFIIDALYRRPSQCEKVPWTSAFWKLWSPSTAIHIKPPSHYESQMEVSQKWKNQQHITWHQYISIHLNIKHIINASAQPIECLQWYGRSALSTQNAWIFWAKLHMPNIMCLQSLLITKSKLQISRTPILATQPDWCSWLGSFGPNLTISNPNASLGKLRFQTSATFCDQWHSEQ